MKVRFLLLVTAFGLAACSSVSENPHHQEALENATKACQKVSKTEAAFQSCLRQRGF